MEEKSYNRVKLAEEVYILKPKLNTAQREIYNWVVDVAAKDKQVLVFVYGHRGTRNTFLWKVLIGALRSEGKIELVVASSAETSLILWDESPMNDHRCFETLDRTLKDIMDVLDKLFGGKSVILGGDFRQTLPVKKGGSKAEIIAAFIAESHMWNEFKVYTLTDNWSRAFHPFFNKQCVNTPFSKKDRKPFDLYNRCSKKLSRVVSQMRLE
nr:DNA helicase [Tanacetum cinerariifolium]